MQRVQNHVGQSDQAQVIRLGQTGQEANPGHHIGHVALQAVAQQLGYVGLLVLDEEQETLWVAA